MIHLNLHPPSIEAKMLIVIQGIYCKNKFLFFFVIPSSFKHILKQKKIPIM
jgi:hypothetical protein